MIGVKAAKKLPRVLTVAEAQAILDACERLRDRFLFALTDDDTIASVRADHSDACAGSREIATAHPDLTEDVEGRHGPVNLAFIYTHCIQELARHAGHGDILCEQLIAGRNS